VNTSPAIGQLVAALATAQAKFRPVTKDRNASIQSAKGSFRYAYADLATAISAIRDALAANGLAILQPVHADNGTVLVTTMLAHSSGEWISEVMSWPVASTDNRSIGSGITYARRHSLLAMVGAAATDEDDDAEQARGGDHDTQHAAPRPPAPPKAPPTPKVPVEGVPAIWHHLVETCKGDKVAAQSRLEAASFAHFGKKVATSEWSEADCVKVNSLLFPDIEF
jgi:hypothetical protein